MLTMFMIIIIIPLPDRTVTTSLQDLRHKASTSRAPKSAISSYFWKKEQSDEKTETTKRQKSVGDGFSQYPMLVSRKGQKNLTEVRTASILNENSSNTLQHLRYYAESALRRWAANIFPKISDSFNSVFVSIQWSKPFLIKLGGRQQTDYPSQPCRFGW